MRVGGVAGGGVVQRRSDGERHGVAGIFDEVDNIAVVKPRYVVVIDGQNAVANVQLRAALGRAVGDDLADERDALRHRRDDDEAETFILATHHRHVVRVNQAAAVANSARIPSIYVGQTQSRAKA